MRAKGNRETYWAGNKQIMGKENQGLEKRRR